MQRAYRSPLFLCDAMSHMKTITIRELHQETGRWIRQASSVEVLRSMFLSVCRRPSQQKSDCHADAQREQDGFDRAALYTPCRVVDKIFHGGASILDRIFRCTDSIVHSIGHRRCKFRYLVGGFSDLSGCLRYN